MIDMALKLKDFYEAKRRIKGFAKETPLIKSQVLSELFDSEIYLKCEFMQEVGSFKIRGASNKILSYLEKNAKPESLVTASSGNHGLAIAYLAKALGMKAIIFVPEIATKRKIEKIASLGAEIRIKGKYSDEAALYAEKFAEENHSLFVHAFDDLEVIAGQGTIGLEIIDQIGNVDSIIVPVGGGGLIAGIATAVKSIDESIKIVGVQSKGNPSFYEALKQGKIVEIKDSKTIAEGIAVRKIGKYVFDLVKDKVDSVVLVSDEEIIRAMKFLLEKEGLIIEPSAAASIAYYFKSKNIGSRSVAILTGRNVSMNHLQLIGYSG